MKALTISLVIILGVGCGLIGVYTGNQSYDATIRVPSWATYQDMWEPATGVCTFQTNEHVQGQSMSVGL